MVAQFAARDAQELTQDALIDASMSMLDVTGTNATLVFQVVGLEIENLAGLSEGSYDTAAETIIELARELKERNDNDGKDAAIAVMEEIQAAELERISVGYSNGQFHMFGMDIDEEDMDAVVADTLENIDDVAIRHDLSAQEKAELQRLLMAYESAETPEQKAQILEQIANAQPEVAQEMAKNTQIDPEQRNQARLDESEVAQRDTVNLQSDGQFANAAASSLDGSNALAVNVSIREGSYSASASPESMFDMAAYSPPADEFNAAAQGQTVLAQTDLTLEPNVAPTLSGPAAG